MTLNDLKVAVGELAAKIEAPDNLLPTFGNLKDEWPNIEIERGGILCYLITERGKEVKHKKTADLDELLYWVFDNVTFSMALKYELAHREPAKDFRRIIFTRQEELLGLLNEKWKSKKEQYHQEVLKRHPYDDLASLRANYWAHLRNQGVAENKINKLAYEKYPINSK